jgi:hypothetical protein
MGTPLSLGKMLNKDKEAIKSVSEIVIINQFLIFQQLL